MSVKGSWSRSVRRQEECIGRRCLNRGLKCQDCFRWDCYVEIKRNESGVSERMDSGISQGTGPDVSGSVGCGS